MRQFEESVAEKGEEYRWLKPWQLARSKHPMTLNKPESSDFCIASSASTTLPTDWIHLLLLNSYK